MKQGLIWPQRIGRSIKNLSERAGFITKGKASVLGKVSKADENIHSLGQKVKNTKAVSAVRSINNSKNQYIADRTSARSDLKKIRKNAKSNIGKSKKHA